MIVDSALYRRGARVDPDPSARDFHELRARATEPGDFLWVGLHEPTHDELADVAAAFDLHPLAVEDAVKAHQRPKLEEYGDRRFVVLKTLWYVDEEDAVETGELALFVGRDFVVSVRHGQGSELSSARRRLDDTRRPDDSGLAPGPSAVVHAISDVVVDQYGQVLDELQVDVDEVETSVFGEQRTDDSARIYRLKREIAEVRRAVLPLRGPMNRFATGMHDIDDEAAPFFRDVADHLQRAAETVDTLDGLLSTAFDAHMAQISIQQNDDMRKISAGVGLVAAPTLVAGIYGMNFDHMPETHWTLGYPFALLMMVLASASVWVFFKRSGWL